MKKYIKIVAIILYSSIILISCQNELDTFNDNPNDPISTNPSLLLAAMEVSTFATHTSGLIRNANVFSQNLSGTSVGQMGEIANYIINEGDVLNEWNTVYNTTLVSGHILNRDFKNDYPYYNGIGQVLTALNLGYATDMWGDVPYDDAFRADEGNIAPKYNTQEEIYSRLQSILDEAIKNLSKPSTENISVPAADDFIFKGDTKKWIKIAYVLKARFAMRLSEVDSGAAQKALAHLSNSGITSIQDDANCFFPGTANGLNQWYAFEVQRAEYLKTGKYFVDYLLNTSDPRLEFMIAKDKNGGYSGNAADDLSTTKTSYIGSAFASSTSSVGLVSYAEAKFIEAEAKLKTGDTIGAKTAMEDAIKASVLKTTGNPATTTFITSSTSTLDLANIIQQKYIALFLTMEPYNDYRRTGFPALIPNQSSSTKQIPVRLPTPSEERLYNPNAIVVSNVTTKLWWDKN